MESLKDALFLKLINKTKELGHQVTFQEMADDQNVPNPNDYAFYYGSFSKAAEEAWNFVKRGDKFTSFNDRLKGVKIVSKKQPRSLSPERTKAVISEFVEMFIGNDGRMPSSRDVKKNRYISESEVEVLRRNGEISEPKIRKLAEEQAGRTFLTPMERRKKQALEERKILKEKEANTDPERGLKKMENEKKGKRYTPEECQELLRKACREARHVLTQAEINELAKTSDLPRWTTLQRQVGPWWKWSEMFDVPFSNDKLKQIAAAKLQDEEEAQPEPKEQLELKEQREPEKPLEPENQLEPVVTFVDPGDALPDISDEENPGEIQDDDVVIEIPIRVIVPKGIKGTVTVSLEF